MKTGMAGFRKLGTEFYFKLERKVSRIATLFEAVPVQVMTHPSMTNVICRSTLNSIGS